MMPHPYYGYTWSIGGFVMLLLMVIFWIAIIVGLIFLIRYLAQQTRPVGNVPGGDSAMQVLRERYARGEISKEEFEQRKRDLT